MRIGHKIGREKKSTGQLALAAEVAFGARVETIDKGVVAVKNVVGVVKQVHHEAAIRHREVARRFRAAGVEMLIVGVERHREHASRPPLKRVLLAVSLPDAGRAVTFGHIDHLFVHVFLRFGFAAGGNLADIGVIGAARAVEHDHGTGNTFQIPLFERQRIDIFDKETPHDRNLLFRLPILVRIDPLRF